MEKNLAKSLTDLIDETLAEIEALKKSDRFSAEEIEMGHDADGSTDTKAVSKADEEDEKEEDEEEHEDEAKKAEEAYKKAEEECEKAEMAYKEAMKKREMCKAECGKHMEKAEDKADDKDDDDKEEKAEKAEGVNQEDKAKSMKKMEKKLAKSIEERVAPLENQISQVLEAVKKLADAPVPARGATYKNVQPLAKGSEEAEPLNKSQVLGELITLKKSGKDVSTEDVLKAEIGSASELQEIATKYGIK